MEIEGRIIQDLGLQSGTSKAGKPWKKREMVLETFGTYPRKVKFTIFGDRVDTILVEPGKDYVLSFDLESREYNGRWYTDVTIFAAREMAAAVPSGSAYGADPAFGAPQGGFQQPATPAFGGSQPTFSAAPASSDEDLPF